MLLLCYLKHVTRAHFQGDAMLKRVIAVIFAASALLALILFGATQARAQPPEPAPDALSMRLEWAQHDAAANAENDAGADVTCAALANGSAQDCKRVILVLSVNRPAPPMTQSMYTSAPVSVTMNLTGVPGVVFNGIVPSDGRVVVGAISSTMAYTAHVGAGKTPSQAPAFSNGFVVPCECDDGAGLLQIKEVVLSPQGAVIPDKRCSAGGSCQPIIAVLRVYPPAALALTSIYSGANITVTTATSTVYTGIVPANGRVVAGIVGSAKPITVQVGATAFGLSFTRSFSYPCVCDDGAGLSNVGTAVLNDSGVTFSMPGCITKSHLPLVLRR
jgi:hypothetical protein